MKKIFFRIVLVLCGVGLSVGVIIGGTEIYLRWKDGRTYHQAFVEGPDGRLNHRLIPGRESESVNPEWRVEEKIDEWGFRTDGKHQITKAKGQGTKRIVMVGDSFVYGWGVRAEEGMAAQLETLLTDDCTKGRIEVINAGVPSYSPSLTYLQLRNGLLDFEPDLVIQAIDMSDVSDEVRYLALSEFDDQGELVRVRPRFIFDNLELNATLAQLRVYYTVTTRLTQSRYGYKKNDEELDHFIGMRDDTGMLAPMGWSLVRKYLSKTKWYMEEEKVMYLVVAVPRSLQVSASLVRKGDIDRYELPDYEGCCQEFFSLLAGMSDELGIEFVNPRETYYEHRDEELYYEADGHFAPRGQALMAEVLSSVVREKLCGEERNGLD